MVPRFVSLVGCLVAALAGCGCEERPVYAMLQGEALPLPEGTPAQGTVFVELLEVEAGLLVDWLGENVVSSSNAVGLRGAVQDWKGMGKARLVDLVAVHVRNGVPAEIGSVSEIRFPEGDEPGRVRQDDGERVDVTGTGEAPQLPRRFAKRDVGMVLEVTAVMDGKPGLVDVSLSPDWGWYLEDVGDMPVLGGTGLATEVSLRSGVYGFLGCGRLPEESRWERLRDGVVLVFVRADVDPVAGMDVSGSNHVSKDE